MDGVSGTGPPVVLLHGGPGLWDYHAPLTALLDDEFLVVRFDQRGCGRSTGRGGPFTIEQAVDDMDQVRSALGFSRWAVAGHSWGAELALGYAAARGTCPVTMISADGDPRPWTATDSLLAALPDASRTVLGDAGHAPWAERPADTRSLIIDALRPALPDG